MHQCAVGRQQRPVLNRPTGGLELLNAQHVLAGERFDILAPQAVEPPAGPQGAGQVLGQYAHVGTLGTQHPQLEPIVLQQRQLQAVDHQWARRALDRQAAPRQAIQRLAFTLERRIHRRQLLLLTVEAHQYRLDRRRRQRRYRAALDDRAFRVPGLGAFPQQHAEPVALAQRQHLTGHPGRLAEADRQHAGSQRIQAAGVPRLDAACEPAYALQRRVGGQSEGLVEQQDADRRAVQAFSSAGKSDSP